MAKTFLGYVEREVDSFVDWSKIGQDITTMLQTEVDLREQKKAAIDEATRKFEEQLQNAPIGEYTELNDYLSRYSDDATQAMLIQERMLKTGQLKVKDYVLGRDNLISGTNGMFAFAKEFQEVYKQKMDGILSDDPEKRLSQRTAHEMELAEGLAKFENTRAVINPTNYKVGIAKTVKNEKTGMVELTDEIMSISQMRNILRTNYKVYNVDKNTQAQADSLGALEFDIADLATVDGEYTSVTRIIDATGELLKGEALTDKDKKRFKKIQSDYKEWEDLTVDRMTKNSEDVASILVDGAVRASNGEVYSYTESEEEAAKNPSKIYIDRRKEQRGVSVVDEADLKLAQDVLRANIRRKVDRKIQNTRLQEKSYDPLRGQIRKENQEEQQLIEQGSRLTDLFIGDRTAKQSLLEGLGAGGALSQTNRPRIYQEAGGPAVYLAYTTPQGDVPKAIEIISPTGVPKTGFEFFQALLNTPQLVTDKKLRNMTDQQIRAMLRLKGIEPDQRYELDANGQETNVPYFNLPSDLSTNKIQPTGQTPQLTVQAILPDATKYLSGTTQLDASVRTAEGQLDPNLVVKELDQLKDPAAKYTFEVVMSQPKFQGKNVAGYKGAGIYQRASDGSLTLLREIKETAKGAKGSTKFQYITERDLDLILKTLYLGSKPTLDATILKSRSDIVSNLQKTMGAGYKNYKKNK